MPNVIMLNFVVLSVVMLYVVMLNVVVLSVVVLIVVAPSINAMAPMFHLFLFSNHDFLTKKSGMFN
jgi:hypothetical protein